MKYSIYHKKRGEYTRKIREDHIELLFDLYQTYTINMWRSDSPVLPENRSQKQYFLERMSWIFHLIEMYDLTKEEKKKYSSNEKQMRHYKITPLGIKLLIQLGKKIDDEHIALAALEALRR